MGTANIQTYERKPDLVQGFQWHLTDGAVDGYVQENEYQPGTYSALVFGGLQEINDGDWIYTDIDNVVKLKSDTAFNIMYKSTTP